MHVIAAKALREFWDSRSDAERPLRQWLKVAERATWANIRDVRAAFPHADAVVVRSGRTATVFNIAGNKYRLATAIHYNRQIIFTLRVLTHAEYGKDQWKEQL